MQGGLRDSLQWAKLQNANILVIYYGLINEWAVFHCMRTPFNIDHTKTLSLSSQVILQKRKLIKLFRAKIYIADHEFIHDLGLLSLDVTMSKSKHLFIITDKNG